MSPPKTRPTTRSWAWTWTIVIPLFVSVGIKLWSQVGDNLEKIDPELSAQLDLLHLSPTQRASTLPGSFRDDIDVGEVRRYSHSSSLPPKLLGRESIRGDTTAVILNWSRFPNVRLISLLLCSTELEDVIEQVFIWNNSPKKIYHHDFNRTGCSKRKLKIYNSSENVYFQARFIACALSSTPYCFIQDDDYLVRPEVIRTLHAHTRLSSQPHTIHLLPPHEHLSSTLREIYVPSSSSSLPTVHTSFAWLGHGTFLHRSEATSFLSLFNPPSNATSSTILNTSDEERRMADNYYTILGNRVPEIWFDQGIELGGGTPFTAGSEGEMRNARHIIRAAEYLEHILASPTIYNSTLPIPYVNVHSSSSPTPPISSASTQQVKAACGAYTACLLTTNIALLPHNRLVHTSHTAQDILKIEAENTEAIGEVVRKRYVERAVSSAVDGNMETWFESMHAPRKGDYVELDFVDEVTISIDSDVLEVVWTVDRETGKKLQRGAAVTFTSVRGVQDGLTNIPTIQMSTGTLMAQGRPSWECHDDINFPSAPSRVMSECSFALINKKGERGRFRRVRVEYHGHEDENEDRLEVEGNPWIVYEIFLRERLHKNI